MAANGSPCTWQGVDNVYDLEWVKGIKYGDIHHEARSSSRVTTSKRRMSTCCCSSFSMYEKECLRLVEEGTGTPAYDYVMKCSHTFNLA